MTNASPAVLWVANAPQEALVLATTLALRLLDLGRRPFVGRSRLAFRCCRWLCLGETPHALRPSFLGRLFEFLGSLFGLRLLST